MAARWVSFWVWAAVAASLAFWALKLFVPTGATPAHAVTVSAAGAVRGDLSRVLGSEVQPAATADQPAPAAEDRRFQLVGVVAPRGTGGGATGVALIAIDGQPPKAYRVGAVVDAETVLQSVSARGASLGPRGGATTVSLTTPELPPPATGVLPAALPGGGVGGGPGGGAVGGGALPRAVPAVPQVPSLPPTMPRAPLAPQPPDDGGAPDDAQVERQSNGAATR